MGLPSVIRYDEVESTQELAKKLVDHAEHGTCVVARRQTAGRGRLGRTWLGPDDGLFLSMLLLPRCAAKDAPHLTLGAAVGVLRALDALGVDARVKWPNDVVIPRVGEGPDGRIGPFRKVCGVIVEVVRLKGEQLEACVLGVGVNVRAPAEGWPTDIARTAGALADAGFSGTSEAVLAAVRTAMLPALDESLRAFPNTLAVLRQRSATLGRRVVHDDFFAPGAPLVGEAVELEADGALVVKDDAGVRHTVRAGDVWI